MYIYIYLYIYIYKYSIKKINLFIHKLNTNVYKPFLFGISSYLNEYLFHSHAP